MPNRARWICAVSLVCAAACAPAWKDRPTAFKVARDEFYPSLKVIAVSPINAPRGLELPDQVQKRFDALIEERLRGEGFQVVPAAELAPRIEAAISARGGIYDPLTGELDQAKADAVEAEVMQAAREQFRADAVLESSVVVRSARVQAQDAEWDGTWQHVWAGSMWSLKAWKGTIPALSVGVSLKRPDGILLYTKVGGLQVLHKVGAKGEPVDVPKAELFADEIRNEQAVHLALDELFGKKIVVSPNR